MRPIKFYAAILAIGISPSLMHAQDIAKNGDYLTKPVRNALKQHMAKTFRMTAQNAGFTQKQISAIAQEIAKLGTSPAVVTHEDKTGNGNGGFNPPTTGASANPPQVVITASGHVALDTPKKQEAVTSVFEESSYGSLYETFPTIRITVKPVPPRDYRVVINGEKCPATPQSVYRVMPGQNSIMVQRTGKPPCSWSGSIASGQEKTLDCKL